MIYYKWLQMIQIVQMSLFFSLPFFLVLFIPGTIPALINLLKSPKIKLQCKTVGLLSNISTHHSIVHAIVEAGGIPVVIDLLASEEPELHSRCAVILYDIARYENKDVVARYVSSFPKTLVLN